uniref:Ovule protein n=1 Tax=Ascaris lumbricoides TaxID=6252 RepID=A0A0M3IN28_ASCLU
MKPSKCCTRSKLRNICLLIYSFSSSHYSLIDHCHSVVSFLLLSIFVTVPFSLCLISFFISLQRYISLHISFFLEIDFYLNSINFLLAFDLLRVFYSLSEVIGQG